MCGGGGGREGEMVGGREGTRGMGRMLVHAEMTGVSGQTGQHNRKFHILNCSKYGGKKKQIYIGKKNQTHTGSGRQPNA